MIRDHKTTTTARLADAAVSDLDAKAGKATVLAALTVQTTAVVNGAPRGPVSRNVNVGLELMHTPDGWKANSIGNLPN